MRNSSAHFLKHPVYAILLIAGLAACGSTFAKDSDPPGTVVYARKALLVPGESVSDHVAIFIRDGRILAIESPASPPPDSSTLTGAGRIIDLSCCVVTPGLIDTQTHLQSQLGLPPTTVRLATWTDADFAVRAMVHARRTLEAGFTTVRDMGNHGDALFALRDAINRGAIPGPRMQVAGEIIRPTGGELRPWFRPDVEALFQGSATCDGPEDCRRAVRAQVARGSDTIKVETKMDLVPGSPSQFTRAELSAIVDEAQRLGVRVTASAFSAESINWPLQAGFDAVVHGVFANAETLELLRSSQAYFIPTLVAARTVREMAENPDTPFSEAWRLENLAIYHGMVESFDRVRRAGLKIAFGTDAGWRPHGGNAEQLVQMVELGMAGADVVAAATVNAADAIGWLDDIGTLEVGKYADIVATAENPVENMSTLLNPVYVLKGGAIVYQRD